MRSFENLLTSQKIAIISAIIIAVSGGIYNGFSTSNSTITSCRVDTSVKQIANFSEDYTSICTEIDTDGNAYTEICEETRYWKKDVSQLLSVTSINNNPPTHNTVDSEVYQHKDGYFIAQTPELSESLIEAWDNIDEDNFDNFEVISTIKHTVFVDNEGKYDFVTKNANYYPLCNAMRENNQTLTLKSWYGISYDVE